MSDNWMHWAACRGMAPADGTKAPHPFFPEVRHVPDEVAAACASCVVAEQCAEAGHRQVGIWAGELRRASPPGQSTSANPQHEAASARRDEIHRAWGRGHSVPNIAAQVRLSTRNVYRHLWIRCSSPDCWCRSRSLAAGRSTEATG